MIPVQARQVSVLIDADDNLPFGRWMDLYVQFKEDGSVVAVEPEEVYDAYVEAGAKIPVEFGEVRILVEDKIAQLQAVL